MKVLGYAAFNSRFTESDAKTLTHIHAAFGRLSADGTLHAEHLSIIPQMTRLRSFNKNLKFCVSVISREPDAFSRIAADEELRKKAAESCKQVLDKYGFDGIDFDWEFPCCPSNGVTSSKDDKKNFTLFLAAVREAIGSDKLMSIATGADLYYVDAVENEKIIPLLDYICVMTYDLKGGFHALSGHHTALYSNIGDVFQNSCDQALRLFVSRGYPKEKLLMGAAFYSRMWKNVPDKNNGFLQLTKSGGGYGPSFAELKEKYINKRGFVRYWDDQAKAPYLFNGNRFISYDDEESVRLKCEYVRDNGYGGIFYWEHSCDPTGTLLGTIGDFTDKS